VVFLSAHSDSQYVTQAVEAGAAGYVLKDAGIEEVVQAILVAAAHQTYLSPAVTGTVMAACRSRANGVVGSAISALTARQREVLQLVAEGWTTKQIALHLHVSSKTVETHRQLVMDKLDLHSVAELTKFAVRQGLTALET
jgi:DNA-binding NarL/FixJ family response regulator